jgi:PHD/YefM family antitoxin component YafN of YafNO toxin-antitoxin module
MVGVTIKDPLELLSKAQKEKLKKKVKETEDPVVLLNSIHYNSIQKYNILTIEKTEELITVILSFEENKRSLLKKKLYDKRLEKSSTEPKWIQYRQLKARGITDLPSPTEINANKDVMLQQLDTLKQLMPNNPVASYIEACL